MEMKSLNGGSGFRIRRPLITTSGFSSDVDPIVRRHLAELNALLARRVFVADGTDGEIEPAVGKKAGNGEKASAAPAVVLLGNRRERRLNAPNFELLKRELRPKRIKDEWPNDSLASALKSASEDRDKITLAELIDRTPELSRLKYAAHESIFTKLFTVDYNTKAVLADYPAIADYLVAFAWGVMDVEEIHGLKSFLINNRRGAKNVATYAAVSAARTIIEQEQLKVPGADDDASALIDAIEAAGIPLSTAAFHGGVRALVSDHVFNAKEAKLLALAEKTVGRIPAGLKPLLVKYIKASPIPITEDNVNFFLPQFILRAQGTPELEESTTTADPDPDRAFEVEFLEDDRDAIQVSTAAVKCAAQLFYAMVLGDELDVFGAMDYFVHRFLLRERIEITDPQLRDDLQSYVFSNEFYNLDTKKMVDRTRLAERKMFYRQVFNYGNGQITEDVVVNRDFGRLWKVLMLESGNYLERARESFNPDNYVSKQNVMQAVEDLQYNLSTHCTGMSNVVTPLIYAEMNFILRRVFSHKEIIRQVVPAGGTWWRVVETLALARNHSRPKATAMYNKAKLGHEILRGIATYDPATFENDQIFSEFISHVDAFITTQSLLQSALEDQLKRGQDPDDGQDARGEVAGNDDGTGAPPRVMAPGIPGMAVPTPAASGDAEWDF